MISLCGQSFYAFLTLTPEKTYEKELVAKNKTNL